MREDALDGGLIDIYYIWDLIKYPIIFGLGLLLGVNIK